MAAAKPDPRKHRRSDRFKRFGPAGYLVVAIATAALALPSALRPPPEQTNDSSALDPGAPPDQQNNQILQSIKQASGGGAGSNTVRPSPSSSPRPKPSGPTPSLSPAAIGPPAKGQCFGNPPRQIESVYSGPCAPGFSGNNGGATGHNVFPNEVRLGFYHLVGAPTPGKVGQTGQGSESTYDRTFRVLQDYFNQRYQTWGRHVSFYGLRPAETIQQQQAEAVRADSQDHIFAANYLWRGFCEEFVHRGDTAICGVPMPHSVYTEKQNRPGLFSYLMDRTQANGYGAEWMCKRIVGKPATHAGTKVDKTHPRKIGIITESHAKGGEPPSLFAGQFKAACGGVLADQVELTSEQDPDGAAQAVRKFFSEGITTIVLATEQYNTTYLMSAADGLTWQPEWIQFTVNGLDVSSNARNLPGDQAMHFFGLGGFEIPRPFPQTECYQAYKSIDPANAPDSVTCLLFWQPMVELMNGIQEAGPHLTRASFEAALLRIGQRFPPQPWAIGGGYGPDDYTYTDNVGEIWFDPKAVDVDGSTGAYRWTAGGKRYQRGQFTADGSQLFTRGVVYPGGPQT